MIELPLKVVKKLRQHEAVVSLQRLWSGESRSEWAEPADTDTAAESETKPANSRLAVRSDADTNLQWGPVTYGYDGSGNIKQTSTTANTDSYVYDSAGRLIQATVKGQTETYAYDAFGNMTAKGITGGASTTIPVDGSSNRLIGPSYDAAGNVLSRDGLEARVRLVQHALEVPPAAGGRNIYAGDGVRPGRRAGGRAPPSRRLALERAGPRRQVIREYDGIRDGNNLFLIWQADYIRGEGGQLLAGETPVWQYNDQNGNGTTTAVYGGLRHYHLDHLGSVRLVTDAGKRTLGEHDYFPYGVTPTKAYQEELNPGTPHIDPMRYAGHQRDFLGYLNVENTDYLDYMHARYYDPKLGRFLSVDPVMNIERALRQPQNWNRYSYVMNNPLRYTDPDGREHVQEPGFTKPLSEAGGWADQPSVSWAFYAEGAALSLAADEFVIGPTISSGLAWAANTVRVRMALNSASAAMRLEGQMGRALGSAVTHSEKPSISQASQEKSMPPLLKRCSRSQSAMAKASLRS